MHLKTAILSCLLAVQVVYGEIEKIQLVWNPAGCQGACVQRMISLLRQIPGVTSIDINPTAGTADLQWGLFATFSFISLRTPFNTAGVPLQAVNLRVRGLVDRSGKVFSVISTGDFTPFMLLGAAPLSPVGNVTLSSSIHPSNFPLSLQLTNQLAMAKARGAIVVVEGSLVSPERFPPLIMISRIIVP